MQSESRLLVYLTGIVFDTRMLRHKKLTYKDSAIDCLAVIDETKSWFNGLQAAAYQVEGLDPIYLVIRGADVGMGKKIFKKTGANERFIPKSDEETSWKITFQDWIYTSVMGSMGWVPLFQYRSLQTFYRELKAKYPGRSFVVSGISLGGLLAQRLYLLEGDVDRCITFSALSPWWTFYKGTQEVLKKRDFCRNDENLVNYYSHHDIFRWSPPLNRQLGKQYNVLLQPFQSRSNLFATLIERFYWAHIPNYYSYSSSGAIRLREKTTRSERWYQWLNQPCKNLLILNFLLLLLVLVFTVLVSCGLGIGLELFVLEKAPAWGKTMVSIVKHYQLVATLVALFLSILFLLPSLFATSNWKWIVLGLNMILLPFPWLWIVLFVLAVCSRSTSDALCDKKESNYGKYS
mgnify:FL=1